MSNNFRFSSWLRLLRAPNLLTVPGDPMAGYLLATVGAGAGFSWSPLCAVGASLCFYCFGLILNDLVDLKVDSEERPERPLPSGEISFARARGAALAFAISGLNLALFAGGAVFYTAAVLAALIIFYNAGFKNLRVVGVVTMGLCRGFSFLLGVFAALSVSGMPGERERAPLILGFVAITLVFVAISTVARREMDHEKPMGMRRVLPFAILLIALPGLVFVLSAQEKLAQPAASAYIFLMIMTLMRAWFLGGILYRAQPVPVTVGGHIRNHLMLQACLCSAAGGWGLLCAFFLVIASQLFALLSRRFYSS